MSFNNYNSEKIIDNLYNRGYTNFISRKDFLEVSKHLTKKDYKIYEMYPDCSKIILYKKQIPTIKLYQIDTFDEVRHQDVLGAIFSLGIKEDTFGDIIKYENHFYIFLLPIIENFIKLNLDYIKDEKINLTEVNIGLKDNFQIEYERREYIISSLRLDTLVSRICNDSRNAVLNRFKNNEIVLNYNDKVKPTHLLKVDDIFSIRKFGKYKFNGIIKTTKKGSYIIELLQYK